MSKSWIGVSTIPALRLVDFSGLSVVAPKCLAAGLVTRYVPICTCVVVPGMNVVLRVSTFDCPGLGAWNPVLAVARMAMASLNFKRA